MRTLTRVGGAFAVGVATSVALLTAPAAYATPPGDNGTVKIHDATTGEELRKNEPHVCTFYLDAFGFDGVQQVDWHIDAWAPTADVKGQTVKSGSLALDADGHGRTEDLNLPDGHYKLFWNFDGEHGAAKHKVFWTDCADDDNGNGTDGGTGGDEPSADPSSSASASPSAGGDETPAGSASSSPSAQGGGSGGGDDLAETGSSAPVGGLSAAGAALLAGGGYLLLRRRKGRADQR